MRPLTPDDLLPLDEYAVRRREFAEAHARYLDRYRRVRVGPRAALVFVNRQTLWFQVQEVLRVARMAEPAWVRQELALCNRLLPGPGRLQAALLVAVAEGERPTEVLAPWQELRGEQLRLLLGESSYPADLLTCRPEDRCGGTAHWVQFPLDATARRLLADFRQPAHLVLDLPGYRHLSDRLGEEVRQSLVDDLRLSDCAPPAAA
jgi:hypothetical protein